MADQRDRPATSLVAIVEGIIARDEREGGNTQRALAAIAVEAVLSHLISEKLAIDGKGHCELRQIASECFEIAVSEGSLQVAE